MALDETKKVMARTSLHECIVAGTILAYVTPTVITEVEEWLPALATERGLTQNSWVTEWGKYKRMLRVKGPDPIKLAQYANGQDPDDAPTVALAETLSACGILSKDSDIGAMGGALIPVEFILEVREYSRKAAVSLSIRIGGYLIFAGTAQALVVALKQCIYFLKNLPDSVKALAFIVLLFVVLYPKLRISVTSWLKSLGGRLPDVRPQIVQIISALAEIAADTQAVPPPLPQPERQ